MLSCRAELEMEIEKLHMAIYRVTMEFHDEDVLEQGIKAQRLLPIFESLAEEDQFRSIEFMQEEIEELSKELATVQVIQERLPLVRKIKMLQTRIAMNHAFMEEQEMDNSARRAITASDDLTLSSEPRSTFEDTCAFHAFQDDHGHDSELAFS